MSDSDVPDHLDANHDGDREQHIEAVRRWVEYIRSVPPEKGDHSRMQLSISEKSSGNSVPATAPDNYCHYR